MSKPFYKFSKEKLTYVKVNKGFFYKLLVAFKWLFITVAMAIGLNLLFSLFFDTPVEKNIRRENERLMEEYNSITNKYNQAQAVLEDIKKRDENIYKAIFEATPYADNSEEIAQNRIEKQNQKSNEELIVETDRQINEFQIRLSEQFRFMDYIKRKSTSKKDYLLTLPAIQPINNPDLSRIGAGYGWKIHPIYKIKKFHSGIDFTAPKGEPVVATGNGVVSKVDRSLRGYGNSVTIDHGNGYKTLYAHLGEIKTRTGLNVKRGDVIGTVGSSGVSLAPHLHYEVIKEDEKVNPINYFFLDLTPEEYEKIIEIANNSGQSFD